MGRALPGPAILFCPADRPDRYEKALAAADAVIIDLEDSVSEENKDAGRAALLANPLDPARVIVRINGATSPHHAADLAVLSSTPYKFLLLPKAESAAEIEMLLDQWDVIALCETPLGVLNAKELASASNVIGLLWGAEDLIAAMHGRSSRFVDGGYRDVAVHARAATLLAAAAKHRYAIDAVYLDIPDLDGLALESQDAVASGFTHKACIHPTQAAVVRSAFRPTADEVARARRIVEVARGFGVLAIDGQMIDAPLLKQSQAVLDAAGEGHFADE
jgi:citrate lyase subunit beta / citryl-CoA lyase